MLTEVLRRTARRSPNYCAVVYRDERLSYGELLEQCQQLAQGLQAIGILPGDRVALVLPNVPPFVVSFFAVAGLGAVVVPINPQFKEEELRFYFGHCDVRAVITDQANAERCRTLNPDGEGSVKVIATGPEVSDGVISFQSLLTRHSPKALPKRSGEEEVLYQYSSGSTGRPKRVARTQQNCWWEAENFVTTTGITLDDTIFCAIPLFHAHGLGNCMFAAVRSGAKLVILEEPNPFVLRRQRALELIEKERATVFPGVPFIFRYLAEAPIPRDVSSLRLCFSAGTALPRSVFDAFRQRYGVPVRQLYGCTEAGSVTINLDSDPSPTAESVGRAMARVNLKILDETGNPVLAGEVGEVAISSPAMTQGYFEMEELNRQAFRDGYFITGDLGRLDEEGRLYITGRKKLFIEVSGQKVDPVEVEDVLAAHPKVREAVVVGVRDSSNGEEIVKAVVVPRDSCREKEVIDFCNERLANFKVPQIVEFRDEIPKSPLGKVLRKYLV